MIKVKLSDPNNMKCFSGFIHTRDLLRDYSIDITESSDYDYEFVDATQFVDLSIPLQESIDRGIENLSKKTGDYFLFHGGDSTAIMGAYEVFIESNAKYLFKKAALLNEIAFKVPKLAIGKNTKTNLQSGIMFGAIETGDSETLQMIDEEVLRHFV